MGARDQGSAEAIERTRRCDVERSDPQARLPGRRLGWEGGSGAISARSTHEPQQAAGRREQVQGGQMQVRLHAHRWGLAPTLILALVCALAVPATAQPRKKKKAAPPPEPAAEKVDKADKAAPPDTPAKSGDDDAVSKADKSKKGDKVKNFDFNALDLNGRMRTPQLLYFLERANEELERASLEKRSFIPHMVRSVEEEQL